MLAACRMRAPHWSSCSGKFTSSSFWRCFRVAKPAFKQRLLHKRPRYRLLLLLCACHEATFGTGETERPLLSRMGMAWHGIVAAHCFCMRHVPCFAMCLPLRGLPRGFISRSRHPPPQGFWARLAPFGTPESRNKPLSCVSKNKQAAVSSTLK